MSDKAAEPTALPLPRHAAAGLHAAQTPRNADPSLRVGR